MRGKVGLLRRSPTFLEEQTSKSKPGPPSWGMDMMLTSFCKKNGNVEKPKERSSEFMGICSEKSQDQT
jgi:hypothetical protein